MLSQAIHPGPQKVEEDQRPWRATKLPIGIREAEVVTDQSGRDITSFEAGPEYAIDNLRRSTYCVRSASWEFLCPCSVLPAEPHRLVSVDYLRPRNTAGCYIALYLKIPTSDRTQVRTISPRFNF